MKVVLTPNEVTSACRVGCSRQHEALLKGMQCKYGFKHSGWSIHIEAAAAEKATAKGLDMYWDESVNTFKRGDIGESIQVHFN